MYRPLQPATPRVSGCPYVVQGFKPETGALGRPASSQTHSSSSSCCAHASQCHSGISSTAAPAAWAAGAVDCGRAAAEDPPRPATAGQQQPCWAHTLVAATFFQPCTHPAHGALRANFFCAPDGRALCMLCADCWRPDHSGSEAAWPGECVQVYRYMHNDVIRVVQWGRWLDLGGIQPYLANGHAAVHLRPREPVTTQHPSSFTSRCGGGCGRALSPAWSFCSLQCKLAAGDGTCMASPAAVSRQLAHAPGGSKGGGRRGWGAGLAVAPWDAGHGASGDSGVPQGSAAALLSAAMPTPIKPVAVRAAQRSGRSMGAAAHAPRFACLPFQLPITGAGVFQPAAALLQRMGRGPVPAVLPPSPCATPPRGSAAVPIRLVPQKLLHAVAKAALLRRRSPSPPGFSSPAAALKARALLAQLALAAGAGAGALPLGTLRLPVGCPHCPRRKAGSPRRSPDA